MFENLSKKELHILHAILSNAILDTSRILEKLSDSLTFKAWDSFYLLQGELNDLGSQVYRTIYSK